MESILIKPIAHIHTDFPEKFGVPRQSMLVPELTGRIIFEPEYRSRDALRGLDGYSHLWLIWGFSEGFAADAIAQKQDSFSPTVRPPRLGGNTRIGVFATRSPNRPNPLALSCVKLERIEETNAGPVLVVSGIDMTDGTPIYDIKPYLPHIDAIPDAAGGFAATVKDDELKVIFAGGTREKVRPDKFDALLALLRQDPRPHYQHDSSRVYYFDFAGQSVSFTVEEDTLTVTDIQ